MPPVAPGVGHQEAVLSLFRLKVRRSHLRLEIVIKIEEEGDRGSQVRAWVKVGEVRTEQDTLMK